MTAQENNVLPLNQSTGFWIALISLISILLIIVASFVVLIFPQFGIKGFTLQDSLIFITPLAALVSHGIASTQTERTARQSELHHSQLEQQLIKQQVPTLQTGGASVIPRIDNITPNRGKQGESLSLSIVGENFQSPKSVRFVLNSLEILGTKILSSDEEIQCKLTIEADQQQGKWDLIIVNSDGREGRKIEAFEIL